MAAVSNQHRAMIPYSSLARPLNGTMPDPCKNFKPTHEHSSYVHITSPSFRTARLQGRKFHDQDPRLTANHVRELRCLGPLQCSQHPDSDNRRIINRPSSKGLVSNWRMDQKLLETRTLLCCSEGLRHWQEHRPGNGSPHGFTKEIDRMTRSYICRVLGCMIVGPYIIIFLWSPLDRPHGPTLCPSHTWVLCDSET